MPWRPLPRIAFAVAVFPFQPSSPADLPLELGDELYIIEQGGAEGQWYRGYLVAPPSLLAGLTSIKGQTLEARVFSGIFPKNCVEIRDILGDAEGRKNREKDNGDRAYSPLINGHTTVDRSSFPRIIANKGGLRVGTPTRMLVPGDDTPRSGSRASTPKSIAPRDPNAPKPAAPVPMLKIGDETPTSYEEPLVDEIASCLREWHSTNLHELLLTRQYGVLENTSNTVLELDLARRQLLHDVLTAQEKNAVRKETVWNLVKGNKMLTGEVIIRDPKRQGRLLTGEDSAIELTILQSQMSMLEGDPSQQADPVSLHHLLLEVNAVSGASPGPLTLAFHLASKLETGSLKPLSETFTLDVPTPEAFATLAHSSKLRTLFTELSPLDFNEGSGGQAQLFLVVTVRASEPARQSLPPKVMTPHSRDGAPMLTRSASTLHSIKGSQKTRRSMMWKQRASEQHRPDPTSPTTPQSAESATQKEIKTSSAKDPSVIRTIGAGVLEIAPIMRQNKDIEQIVTIWSPLPEESEEDHQSEGFDELIRNIIPSPTGRYSKSYRASRLQIHLYPFVNSDSDALIRNNPTLMHDIAQTRRMGFPAAPNKPRSDIYLTLAQAVIPHDAVLSHPQTLQAPLPLHAGLRNLQLTLEVRDVAGNRIERCIFPSSSSTGHTAWRTTVAEKGTPWDQTICLKLSADQVVGSHVIMSVANAPEFPFGLCWLPLWDQQAFQRDGKHSLLLHAYDKHTSNIDETGKGAYISLPWSAPGKLEASKLDGLITPFAVVQIETNLCSTEFSQDQVILGLIHATDKEAIEVLELLRRVLFVPEIEIVKQLRSVFDALFNILVSNAGSEEYEDLIFNNLVRVLGIVHDRRFNLGPLVDRYIEDQFDFPSATPCLVRSYLRLLQGNIDSPQQSRTLRAAFKVGRHLLKFITNAREQQKEKEVDTEPTQVPVKFNKDMHSIFKALESLMRNPSPVLVGSKTLVVQHFHTWLPELASVLGKDEMIMIALSFMDSCKDVKGMLTLYKLVLIQNCARLPLFSSGQDRETFISGTVGWLEPYWGITGDVSDQYRDQVRLCSAIVAELVKTPEPQLYLFMPKIVASYCAIALEGVEETNYLSMLYSKSFPFQVKVSNRSQKFDEALVELAGLIAAISNIPDPVQPPLKGDDLAIFLSHALEAHRSIISCEAYPEDWLSLHIYHHRAAVKSMDFLLSLLIEAFLPSPEDADSFDMKLWEAFFATLLKVVSSASLALETFPEQKRRATWKIGGDVREQGANLLRRGWEAIGWDTTEEEREQFGLTSRGGFQVQYVPSLVPATIELCLSVHEGLRRVAVEILQTMILSEWDLNQDLTIIEMEIISSLDVAFQSKEMKENTAQKLFINELTDLFGGLEDNDDDGLSAAVRELIETIDELLDLLLACHNSGGMSESLHTLRLMEFMKDLGREDIFVRYVHELAQSQIAERNHAEAGLALQFHADLYDWDVTKLVPVSFNPALPEQTAFDRKEALYFDIIQHFEDGKAWTHALACYKELAEQYEHTVLDFSKLSRAQSSIAKIYEYIAKEHKYFPRYFRVTYRGLGFSPSLRDKQFIFEGPPSERMASFTDRMQKQYPAAQIISSGELEDIEGQFLQISAVSAHRNTGHPVYQRSKVPHSVREHLLISNPSQFSVTSKRHTNSGSVKEQWVEKTIFTTAEPFPNLLRRSEIIVTEEVSLTPLQTAIERTWRKTQELILLEQRAVSGDDSTLSPLMEALNQLLDVGSSSPTCVAQYRQFLSQTEGSTTSPGVDENDYGEDEDESEPKPIDPQENALAVALIDHALAIRHALGLLARPAHQATQAELQRRFEDAFGPELSSLSVSPPPQTSLTTPRAVESRSTPVRNSASRDKQGLIRSISPEEELIRSSRSDEFRKHTASKSSIGQRISIMNPFKRANHATGDSVGTIKSFGMNLSNHHHSDSKASKINGKTIESRSRSGSRNASTTQLSRRSGEGGVDDDAATVHSSRSKGTQSEKRKSWFGGDPKPLRRASPSLHGDAAEFSRPSTQKSVASPDRSDSVTAISTKSIDETRRFEVKSNDSPILASSEGSEGRKDGSDQGTSPTALPVSMTTALTERPSTRDSHRIGQLVDVKSTSHSVTISATNNSPPTGGMRDSVMKRFSLLKGVGRKNSRINVRDGGLSTGAGGVIAESVHE